MGISTYLFASALLLGQAGDRTDGSLMPQLAPGLELVYAGTYLEESLIPNVQFQRHYRLDTNLLVLDARLRHWDVAILTTLSLYEPRQGVSKPAQDNPSSVRLELAQVDQRGRVRTPTGLPLLIPTAGPPTLELGFLAEVPPGRVNKDDSWEVAEEGRPVRGWQLAGAEVINGITCFKLVGQQQSDDWDRPRADRAAWRRRDTLWLSPQLFVAQKVERVIERRDPLRPQPTQRSTVRYELESRLRYPGKLFEDRRQEIGKAQQFHDEAAEWFKQPAQHRLEIDNALRRIGTHLEQQAATPYRRAVLHLKSGLEAARRGESPVAAPAEEAPALPRAVELGQRVPDFVVTSLTDKDAARLDRCLGKPILVVFYSPHTAMGKEVLVFAKRLAEAPGSRLAVLAMAITQDVELARKQHRDLRLPFPILDGQGMRQTFGADATPRLVLLDHEGVVRAATTGWGLQTASEITEILRRCQER
jgi:peroxiredoxin